MGYGWISDEEIKSRSNNNAYRKGYKDYRNGVVLSATRGMIIPYAGADKEHDCISVIIREQESTPKRKGSGKDGSYLVQVYAMGVTLCDCQAAPRLACRHTVAAMHHIMDNLEEIGAESPKGMNSIRGEKDGEYSRYNYDAPDLLFEKELIVHRGNMEKARAKLKMVTSHLGDDAGCERWLSNKTTQDRARSKDLFTTYMSYLQKLMINHADTPQKKIQYVRYLAWYLERTCDKFVTKVYINAMMELACRDAEWFQYVTNATKTSDIQLPLYNSKIHPDRRR